MGAGPLIFVVTGEPSGDQHAAMLGEALRERAQVRLQGVGQRAMRAAGFDLLFDSAEWGAIGLYESLARYPRLAGRARQIRDWVVAKRPDLFILVDFGAFNVRLARMVRRLARVPTLYYFPPRSWSHRASGYWRLADVIDRWATPFQWSAQILQAEGLDATWVGHPVVDRIQPVRDTGALRAELGLQRAGPLLGLLPGSRSCEVAANAPEMLGAARIISREVPGVQVVMSVAPSIARERLEALIGRSELPEVRLMDGTVDIARAADLVITSAGTATLDLTAAGCPMVVAYRGTSLMRLEEAFRRMGRLTIALPNIVAGRRIVPELTGAKATPRYLAAAALQVLGDPERLAQVRHELLQVREMLGEPGVSGRVADIALEMVRAGAQRRERGGPAI